MTTALCVTFYPRKYDNTNGLTSNSFHIQQ